MISWVWALGSWSSPRLSGLAGMRVLTRQAARRWAERAWDSTERHCPTPFTGQEPGPVWPHPEVLAGSRASAGAAGAGPQAHLVRGDSTRSVLKTSPCRHIPGQSLILPPGPSATSAKSQVDD